MPRSAARRAHEEISLVYAVGRVNQGIRRELRRRLAEWNVSVPQLTALSVLGRRPGLSNAQLARRTMVTPQAMIEILAELEARGLVRRTVDPTHGRILRAQLTAEGRALLSNVEPAVEAIQDEILQDIPPHERAVVLDVMLKAMQRLGPGLDRPPSAGVAAQSSPSDKRFR
jgi:DNA-binding MarR family transcriptional regulator